MSQDLIPVSAVPATRPGKPALRGSRAATKRAFCESFLLDYNPTLAAKAAGAPFGHEAEFATDLLREADVRRFLSWGRDEQEHGLSPSKARIQEELNATTFFDPGKVLELRDDGTVKGFRFDRIDGRCLAALTVRRTESVKGSSEQVSVKFVPRFENINLQAKMAGMAEDEGRAPAVINFYFGDNVLVNNGPTR